jgi:hypothetical protein
MDFEADRKLWDAAQSTALPRDEDLSHWGFSVPQEASATFHLTISQGGKRESAFVSLEHAPMLALFDLSYWTAHVDTHLNFDEIITRNLCFLHKLRRQVEKEILGARPGCTTLRFWAVRSIRYKNHFVADASELQKEGAYSHWPNPNGKNNLVSPHTPGKSLICSIEWAAHLVTQLRWITKDVEMHLQEGSSEARTGQPDSLSFVLNELGLKSALQRANTPLPFKPGKRMPDLVALGRKRGLSAATITDMSKRARNDVVQGTELSISTLAQR